MSQDASNALSATPEAGRVCGTCGGPLVSTRSWSRFCRTYGDGCRNAYHAAEARMERLREAAPAMYEALRQIADPRCGHAELIAQEALAGLKPPVEPKALLEKKA